MNIAVNEIEAIDVHAHFGGADRGGCVPVDEFDERGRGGGSQKSAPGTYGDYDGISTFRIFTQARRPSRARNRHFEGKDT